MNSPKRIDPNCESVLEELVCFVQENSCPNYSQELLRYEVELQVWISNLCQAEEQFANEAVKGEAPAEVFTDSVASEVPERFSAPTQPPSEVRSRKRRGLKSSESPSIILRPWAVV